MPTRQEMLTKIYEVIWHTIGRKNAYPHTEYYWIVIWDVMDYVMQTEQTHCVKDEDVIHWLTEWSWYDSWGIICKPSLLSLWWRYNERLDNQSDECIQFVYSLLPTK